MFDCCVIKSYSHKKTQKKSRTLVYWFELTMEGTGASDEEAPPTNVRKKDLTKSQRLEAISILRVKYIDSHFERGAIIDIAIRFNVACTTIWRLWQRAVGTHAVGIINSPKLVSWKKILGEPLSICQSLLRMVSRMCR